MKENMKKAFLCLYLNVISYFFFLSKKIVRFNMEVIVLLSARIIFFFFLIFRFSFSEIIWRQRSYVQQLFFIFIIIARLNVIYMLLLGA